MFRLFIVSIFVLASLTASAQQQGQQVFTLQITESDLLVIGQGLENLPYGRSAPVIARLQQQVNEQLDAQKKAPADKKKR